LRGSLAATARSFAVTAALLIAPAALVAAGCASAREALPAAVGASRPERWTIAIPRAYRELPDVQALVAARTARFTVEVIDIDPAAGTPAERLDALRTRLAEAERGAPAAGGGERADGVHDHLLVVASPAVIPMGPWAFEGAEAPIATDWLLSNDVPLSGGRVAAGDWQRALASKPRRTVGRIPFDDLRMVSVAMRATLAHDRASTADAGSALLGASGTAYAWTMASARGELRTAGWDAALLGEGGSCDGPSGAFSARWRGESGETRPALVCVAGAPYEALDGNGPGRGIRWILQTVPAAESPALLGNDAALRGRSDALMVAFVPGFARAESPDIASLFAWRQAAAIAGFTGDVALSPVGPALRGMTGVPSQLAEGMPIGIALEASRLRYWAEAGDDLAAWMPAAAQDRAQIALSAVLYGDPALQAARTPKEAPKAATVPVAESTPVVVPAPAPAAEEPSSRGMTRGAMALTLAFFAILVAVSAAWGSSRKA
jgi:hypothetical protein